MSVYLDNAATSFPKPESVYLAVEHAMRQIGVGPGRGGHHRGMEATRLIFEARELLADFFGACDSSRFIFTHSATESLNLAINGLLRRGDHVVSTTMEHNSLARPLHLAAQRGVDVSWVEGDLSGYVSAESIATALRPDTRLIAISHCSNLTGTIQPVEEIGKIAARTGALLLVDAAQSAGSLPINIAEMNIHLLAAPGHKGLLGPQGTGFLYIAEGVELIPLLVGGTGSHSEAMDQPIEMPERFESGTMNTPGIAGLKAGIEFIRDTGIAAIRRHETALISLLVTGLQCLPGITVYGPADLEQRGNAISFTVTGHDPSMIGFALDREFGICVRTGLHCAPYAHKTIGTFPTGTIRVSPGVYNAETDITLFLSALSKIIARRAA